MNILNLGSGDNPMTSAINVDIRIIKGVNVVASAEQLPFIPLCFQKIFSHNPFGYNPVSKTPSLIIGEPKSTTGKPLDTTDTFLLTNVTIH